jgi:hypothetical protein
MSNLEKKIMEFLRDNNITMLCLQKEYQLLDRYHHKYVYNFDICAEKYFYYPIDSILGDKLINSNISGNKIIIGNSCSYTNNHVYVYDLIKNFSLKEKEIVSPLNYGGDIRYQQKVINYGRKCFGNKFHAITEFLPLCEYNQLLSEGTVFISGCWRAEAMGNVVIALYLGSKVFLSNRSPMYNFFKRQGVYLYELETISENSIHTSLTITQVNHNKEILIHLFNEKKLHSLTKTIFG